MVFSVSSQFSGISGGQKHQHAAYLQKRIYDTGCFTLNKIM